MNNLKDYVNWKLTHADKVAEAEGYPLTMENCKRMKKMKELKIYGNSVQDGTPTPDAPIEVVSVGEKSVNLTDGILEVGSITNATGQNGNSSGYFRSVNYTSVNPNTPYIITASKQIQFVYFYDKDYNFIKISSENVAYFTTPENCEYIRYRIIRNESNETVDKIMLVQGSTVASYEPYGKYKIPIVQRGINLLEDAREIYKSAPQYKELTEDGRECVRFTSELTVKYKGINFKENTQYTISFDCKVKYRDNGGMVSDMGIAIFYTDGTYKGAFCNKDDVWRNIKITSQAGKTISSIGIYSYEYRNWIYVDINTYQIEEGTAATEYEPYVEPITTNVFLNEPLRKIGDYADYIDFKNDKVVRKIDKKSVTYSEGDYGWWSININTEDRLSVLRTSWFNSVYVGNHQIFSELFPYKHWNNIKNTDINLVWCAGVSGGFLIDTNLIDGYNYSWTTTQKRDAFLKWAESVGLYWYLARKTPREEPLNIDLPKLNAKTSIIEVDTSLAPSNAYGKYIKK